MPPDREDPRSYNLAEKQLAYLLDEDIAKRSPTGVEQDIQETTSKLHLRLKYLIEDVCMLHAQGYLDEWDEAWDEVTDLQREDQLINHPLAIRGARRDEIEYIEPAVYFGHVCRLLYSSLAPDFDETKIAMGVLVGLSGGWLKEEWATDSALQKFMQDLPEKGARAETFTMPDDDVFGDLESVLQAVSEASKKESITFEKDELLREYIKESDLSLTPALFSHAQQQLEDKVKPSNPAVVRGVVKELERDQELLDAEALADLLHEDCRQLLDTSWKGLEAIDIFRSIYTTDNLQDPQDIAKEVDSNRQLVSKLVNDIEGRVPPWRERPLIIKEVSYTPTSYGSLVGQSLRLVDTDDERTAPSREDIIRNLHEHILEHTDSAQCDLVIDAIQQAGIDPETTN